MNSAIRKDKKRLLFYICGISLPILQFVIFYVVINFSSIMLAFQNWDIETGYSYSMSNFPKIWNDIVYGNEEFSLSYAFLNSIKFFLIYTLFGTGFNILFSNYIYKKNFGSKAFQILLFLPKILSVVVLSVVFNYAMNEGAVALMKSLFGIKIDPLMFDDAKKFGFLIFFSIWSGFGTGVLMYTSTMTGIPKEVVESADLDGITPLKELIFITIPMIYPTFVTFMVVNISSLFIEQVALYNFYALSAPDYNWTIGYFIYSKAMYASAYGDWNMMTYLSAFGLILSAIAIPLTFLFKWILEKVGPKFE